MLDRIHGQIVFICDGCDDVLETETTDFNEAREMLRADDWRTSKDGDDWVHRCPSCGPEKRGLGLFGAV